MRLNNNAMDHSIKSSRSDLNFWHYTSTTVSYDPDTQEPTRPGEKVAVYADIMDFTIQEIENNGGLVDTTSKKVIVAPDVDIIKGDEILDSTDKEQYKIVFVREFSNRKHLFANLITSGNTQH